MNTFLDFELQNGDKIKLTLNLKRLLILKSKYKDIYDKVNRIITKGAEDIFDMVQVIYASYLCAFDNSLGTEPMSYEVFMDAIPQNINDIATVVGDLIAPKKK